MKKCPNCGRMYSDMVSVCPECKTQLGSNSSSNSYQRQTPQYMQQTQQPQQYVQQTQQTQQYTQPEPQPTPKKDSGNFLWGVLGFLIPIVGVILYFCWKNSKPKTASVALKGAAIGFVLNVALSAAGF